MIQYHNVIIQNVFSVFPFGYCNLICMAPCPQVIDTARSLGKGNDGLAGKSYYSTALDVCFGKQK